MTVQKEPTFDFAISCAGEDCGIAEELADRLVAKRYKVFLYSEFRTYLFGKDMRSEFGRMFGPGTKFFIPLISQYYATKAWAQFEWAIAIEEASKRKLEFILPVRLDGTLVPGLAPSVNYLDLREVGMKDAVELLAGKCRAEVATRPASYLMVATFGLVVDELRERDELPPGAPREYPILCDWLEDDLLRRLSRAPIRNVEMTEASLRDGECLSVRVSFEWDPGSGPLTFADLRWWQTLEVAPYDEVYPPQ